MRFNLMLTDFISSSAPVSLSSLFSFSVFVLRFFHLSVPAAVSLWILSNPESNTHTHTHTHTHTCSSSVTQ